MRPKSALAAAVLSLVLTAPPGSAAPQIACFQPPPSQSWSNPASWPSGTVPGPGACVTIPAGTTKYLDVSTAPLAGLDVQGVLVFVCGDLTLTSDWIQVTGRLQAGSGDHPHHGLATIRLTHSYACGGIEQQMLAVEGSGLLRLIGEARAPSWTRLAATAPAGTATIALQAAPSWRSGQTIVVTSTDFDRNQAEVRTISSVNGTQVTLTQPLTYTHWGVSEGVAYNGVGVPEYAEVALFERNIVVEGTPYVDTAGHRINGHTVLRNPGATPPRAELEWVEFRDLGKEGTLAKYPLHFHHLGDATGSWIKNCSIHRSVNRTVSIHDSQNVVVTDNFSYDVLGHAYYFEDGTATGCTMSGNLGLLTEPPQFPTIPSDAEPATFWLFSPQNKVEDNVAAGAASYGFWFETTSGDTTPWTSFRGNVAHSNELSGFFQDTRPRPAPASVYQDVVAYKNREYGMWLRSYGTSRIVNAALADNRGGFYLASEGFQFDVIGYLVSGQPPQPFEISKTTLEDSLVIGESTNLGTPTSCEELAYGRSLAQAIPFCCGILLPKWSALTGVELYDGLIGVENTIFADFQPVSISAPACSGGTFDRQAGALHQVRYNSPWAVDPRNYVTGVTFPNAVPVYFRTPNGVFTAGACGTTIDDGGVANSIIQDLDGSLTGTAGSVVFPDGPNEDFLVPYSGATKNTTWNAYVTAGPPSTPFAQLDLYNLNELLSLPFADLVGFWAPLRSELFVKPGPLLNLCQANETRFPRYITNIVTDDVYEVYYDPAVPQTEWARAFALTLHYTEPGRWAYVTVPLLPPTPPGTLFVDVNTTAAQAAPDPVALYTGPGNEYWYDTANQRIHIKIRTGGTGSTIFDGTRTVFTVYSP